MKEKSRIYKYPHKKKQIELKKQFRKEINNRVREGTARILNLGLWKTIEKPNYCKKCNHHKKDHTNPEGKLTLCFNRPCKCPGYEIKEIE